MRNWNNEKVIHWSTKAYLINKKKEKSLYLCTKEKIVPGILSCQLGTPQPHFCLLLPKHFYCRTSVEYLLTLSNDTIRNTYTQVVLPKYTL